MAIHTLHITEVNDQSNPLSQQIILAVARHTDTDPLDLPALHHFVDADALDALFDTNGSFLGEISFRYWDTLVTVADDGEMVISVENA